MNMLARFAPIADGGLGTEAAWWDRVAGLKDRSTPNGTTGDLVPHADLPGDHPFGGRGDGDTVVLDHGVHRFSGLDLSGLAVVLTGTAVALFENVRFRAARGANALIQAEGSEVGLGLAHCDLIGPGDGTGPAALLLASPQREDASRPTGPDRAALTHLRHVRVWGQSADAVKIGRGTIGWCYIDPGVGTDRKPVPWRAGAYERGAVVTDGSIVTSHAWVNTVAGNTAQPRFDQARDRRIDYTVLNGWRHVNVHGDQLHLYAQREGVVGWGCYIEGREGQNAEAVPGYSVIGINQGIRFDNGDVRFQHIRGPRLTGFMIPRDGANASKTIASALDPYQDVDGEWLVAQHMRIGGRGDRAVDPRNKMAFREIADLGGAPLDFGRTSVTISERSTAFFERQPDLAWVAPTFDPSSGFYRIGDGTLRLDRAE